jgi:nitronate monooxygenase
MAGGPSTPALAAEVSRAGGLGFLGCAYSTPDQILEWSREVRSRTDRPFGINLFADVPDGAPVDPAPMLELLRPIHAELGLPPPEAPTPSARMLDAQVGAVIEGGAAVFSITFGLLSPPQLERLKRAGLVTMGTANTVEEARRIEAAGFHSVIAQGSEAGGHRATFVGTAERGLVGTMALVPQVVDAVAVPVVAAGGIMDGRGWIAAESTDDGTTVTRAYSGRAARGLVTRFLTGVEERPGVILPYPLQNALTRPMRQAANRAGRAELLSLWAGQAARLARRGPAAEIVRWLVADAARVRAALQPS